MRGNKKYVRRTFWVHQHEKEEELLSKMASEGWHFAKIHIGIPQKYEFIKGEKINYIYQLDFVTNKEDTEDYHQLFADAGWEEVYSWFGIGGRWYYFRKESIDGKVERIFSDYESKFNLYNKLLKTFGPFFIAMLFIEINAFRTSLNDVLHPTDGDHNSLFMLIMCCFFMGVIVLIGYWILGLIFERNKIKNRLNQKL